MPDDDWALGQNQVDVRNEARREYQRSGGYDPEGYDYGDDQISLCTNDERCQAAADEHDPGCPKEQQLLDEFNF